jgi:alkaline phosphatase D
VNVGAPGERINNSVMSRRTFAGLSGMGAAAVLLGTGAWASDEAMAKSIFSSYPFALGVASGDPLPDGVVLWTRLAPQPLAADGKGGMPPRPVSVRYEVATDDRFRNVVRRGTVQARPELGHSVHPEVWGLLPDREYFYRFSAGSEVSPVGRTKTAPAPGASVSTLSFAFASCQSWPDGYFTAHRHLAEEDLDLVVHLGDYLYEYGIDATGGARNQPVPDQFRSETVTLDRYRLQYGLYKLDPDLQAAHAAHPWIITLDDHEVENNWADEIPEASSQTPTREQFLVRRANAFRAYYENQPLRHSSLPTGPDLPLYRRLTYGDLAQFSVIDTRQYRDDQPAGDGVDPPNAESLDPARTMMGEEQEGWLLSNFARSRARWDVVANQAPMAETDTDPGPEKRLFMDPWDGYVANRNRVLTGAVERGVDNLVVITGDRHQNYAMDLKQDYYNPDSAVVGSEFVGTSISSGGNGADMTEEGTRFLAANEHMKFFNAQRGYVRCTVTPQEWRSDYRVVPYVDRPGAPITTRATYVVEDGVPGVQQADAGRVVGQRFSSASKSEGALDAARAKRGQ